jgi:hypothetical protein
MLSVAPTQRRSSRFMTMASCHATALDPRQVVPESHVAQWLAIRRSQECGVQDRCNGLAVVPISGLRTHT